MNVVCQDQRCTCPTNFEEYDIDAQTTVCRLGRLILKLYWILCLKLLP